MKGKERISPAALSALLRRDTDNFITATTLDGIEAQEAQGQRDYVASQTLPLDSPWDELKALGVKKRKEVVLGEDDIFVPCTLPEGWSIVPTDHSMWSNLQDANGKTIASIFYKAAFYDRRAFLRLKEEE